MEQQCIDRTFFVSSCLGRALPLCCNVHLMAPASPARGYAGAFMCVCPWSVRTIDLCRATSTSFLLKVFVCVRSRVENTFTHHFHRPRGLLRPRPGHIALGRLRSLIQVQDHVGEELSDVHILWTRTERDSSLNVGLGAHVGVESARK